MRRYKLEDYSKKTKKELLEIIEDLKDEIYTLESDIDDLNNEQDEISSEDNFRIEFRRQLQLMGYTHSTNPVFKEVVELFDRYYPDINGIHIL